MDETSLPLRIHALRAVEVVAAMRAQALADDSTAKRASARDGETAGCAQAKPVGNAA